ncbi:hypothetical protein [Neptuniibacter sp.]|uniref:hypothetical protein n=1 Tax=Neptuniibacter sp. TaxID=1962643 RepID=UPI003B596162
MFSTLTLQYAKNKNRADVWGKQYFVAYMNSLDIYSNSFLDAGFRKEFPEVDSCKNLGFYLVIEDSRGLHYIGRASLAVYAETKDTEDNFLQKLIKQHSDDQMVMSNLGIKITDTTVAEYEDKVGLYSRCEYELNEDANILIVNKPDEDNVIEYLHSYFDYDRIKKEKANVRSEIHAL